MSSYYPEGGMAGSGIFSETVSYDEFECVNDECEKLNEADDILTDDWGNYTIECAFCGMTYREGNLDED
jgi:hypothetical protein